MTTITDRTKGEQELLAYCEKGREIGTEADTERPSRSPGGAAYIEIITTKYYKTFHEVMAAAKEAFDDYAVDRKGKLYWRKRPELDHSSEGWRFYMRLIIA